MDKRSGNEICSTFQIPSFALFSKDKNKNMYFSNDILCRKLRNAIPFRSEGIIVKPSCYHPILVVMVWDVISLLWMNYICWPFKTMSLRDQKDYLAKMLVLLSVKISMMEGEKKKKVLSLLTTKKTDYDNEELSTKNLQAVNSRTELILALKMVHLEYYSNPIRVLKMQALLENCSKMMS
ncbi:uncharacterized protein OCT59_028873 [Rhizophagus irregularis]|uniref:Uncharacterized protein n=1 Tax=Rhizophagus irregularis (strain DAOM 181602 / DAOM 197198 / MUCL 43194) TaxID=747089 RepID=U9T763_RHIID|nr:hypothetical protein OCT59_028873 [Rhizophagus irregularis]GBC52463.1 hypothetical protein RIR_jg27330.t1 [Rhizophagus irregularis DAOM 181602=DAOM 197198]CAG8707911.1 18005_t:CDS:2 [Rhizophagus irregularis]